MPHQTPTPPFATSPVGRPARRLVRGRRDRAITRLLDLAGAGLGLALLSPVFAGISIAVKRHDGGPIFYRGLRVGKGGKHFRLYKFRTMIVDADRVGPGLTASGDARITPIGSWLRRTKLDELPQLINVLLGEMSLVGPRPEDPRYVALYTSEQRQILLVKPGITSPTSLAFRREEQLLAGPSWETVYRTEIMPAKIKLDLDYLARRSVWSDLKWILRTAAAIFK